jgi:hypothetical protein
MLMLAEALCCVLLQRPANRHVILRVVGLPELVPYLLLHPETMPNKDDVMLLVMQTILLLHNVAPYWASIQWAKNVGLAIRNCSHRDIGKWVVTNFHR